MVFEIPKFEDLVSADFLEKASYFKDEYDFYSITKVEKEDIGKILEKFKEDEEVEVKTAGRVMSLRIHGKSSFIHIDDEDNRIQVYLKQDLLGEKLYKDLKKNLKVGDIVWVKGKLFRTRTGEITIRAEEFLLLAKTYNPLPEKWHGLKDVELRYRRRYLDLIVNKDVRDRFKLRSKALYFIRNFFVERGFIEVETPILNVIPTGAAARPFITHHNALDMDMYLRIAPELFLKRLIVGGYEKVFELGRVFRNEGLSNRHNPEFTMLEAYQAFGNYEDAMDLVEELIKSLAKEIFGKTEFKIGDNVINLDGKWERKPFLELISQKVGEKIDENTSEEKLLELVKKFGLEEPKVKSWGKLIEVLFELVEPDLINPTFVIDYPVEISPLAKRKPSSEKLTERFELYINGWEITNAFSELNDPYEQYLRFKQQLEEKDKGDEEAHSFDEDFIRALAYGMPPTVGLGIGIDRLMMILTETPTIRDVILFPTLRKEELAKKDEELFKEDEK